MPLNVIQDVPVKRKPKKKADATRPPRKKGKKSVGRKARFYNCLKCPAYCCTYDYIETTEADIRRLAKHFGKTVRWAKRKLTKPAEWEGREIRVLRHKKDRYFGTACQFLDQDSRNCTIYHGRPHICRAYPDAPRCGFYDFIAGERSTQEDPDWIPHPFTRGKDRG